ncbi:MAG: indolepyruvate oxidoreductase subunit beta [Patescibacteria group bacterium]|nr:indolepyruvate oxidoreductase subunit beta [Patescibacteria group bacterium]
MDKTFNIVICGVGGQGLVTLLNVLARAAFIEGYDVKTSELHGLSQRGGSVEAYVRFGRRVWSPIISKGTADLVIALEEQEALNGARFAGKKSVILINRFQTPTLSGDASFEQIRQELTKVSEKVFFVGASEICQKELGVEVVSGIYLLGYALHNNYLPLKKENVIEAIKKTMPEKFWELNIKALELAKQSTK